MTQINLPFQLKEGQKAYAAKVMANFNALLGKLNALSINGELVGSLEDFLTSLSEMVDAAVEANKIGNANEIRFTDGMTMQEKLDSGDLNGISGNVSVQDRMCYFYVDQKTGHLHLVARNDVDATAYTINDDGHLIYTIPEPDESLTAVDYDLGNVTGPMGPQGEMSAGIYDPQGKETDIYRYVDEALRDIKTKEALVYAYAANWVEAEDGTAFCRVELLDMSASSKFDVGLSPGATDDEESAFEKAMLKVSEQGTGYFVLSRRNSGSTPGIDLPLVVRIYP